jgi:predicted dienelactone hydrolase
MRLRRAITAIASVVVPVALVAPGAGAKATPTRAARPVVVHRFGTYRVSRNWRTFIDHTRPTPPDGTYPGANSRTLRTLIFMPHGHGIAHHPVPLIVFAQGVLAEPQFYSSLLRRWATAGFIIAAPDFPTTAKDSPGGVNLADRHNQPGDVDFVLKQLVALDKTSGNEFTGRIQTNRLAVAGHSLGAVTTLALVADSCCQVEDPRIRAAIVLSGQLFSMGRGQYYPRHTRIPPLLFVNGTKDDLVPNFAAKKMYAEAPRPRFQVIMHHAPHVDFTKPWGPVLNRTVLAMLNRYVVGTGTVKEIVEAGTRPGVATMRHRSA